jgi:hypothetical protein
MTQPVDLDKYLRLVGYEDCQVDVRCNECWDGVRPIIYYDRYYPSPYDPAEVVEVKTISEMWSAMVRHVREVHGPASPE